MIIYLILCSLLIPVNIWAAITPHLHSDLSMRILHGLSTLVLLPLLWSLWSQRRLLQPLSSIVLAVFSVTLVWVNSWITAKGMPVDMGWLDHLMLAAAEIAVVLFFLVAPDGTDQPTAEERTR
tara:strand:+ start:1417 stop:1785 length:369 start_codon:yes stop_codon:yes gene_type:complete